MVGLQPCDRLFVKVKTAYDAIFALSMDLHDRGFSSGIGLSQRKARMSTNDDTNAPTEAKNALATNRQHPIYSRRDQN